MIVSERSSGITASHGNTNAQVTGSSGSITVSNPLQGLIPPGMGTVTTAAAIPDTLSCSGKGTDEGKDGDGEKESKGNMSG